MVDIIGRKVESGEVYANETLVEREDGLYAFPRKVSALKTTVDINPQDYALIQEGDQAVCAMSMTQGYNGRNNQDDTIIKVLETGLRVPRASRFIRQLLNVNQAFQGKGVLYDASGNLIKRDRLEKYIRTLNYDYWVWSPEFFEAGKGHLDLDVVTISELDERGDPVYKREPLERCLEDDCYADLDSANSQGFLTQRSKTQKYEPGKIVYFYCPTEISKAYYCPRINKAVGFDAAPDGADFSCNVDPRNSDSKIGAFTCVEEVKTKKESSKNK